MTQKRYVVRQIGDHVPNAAFYKEPEVSTTSDSKVMTQIVVFMVFGDLDLDIWPIFTKKKCKVSWVCRIYGNKIILIGAKLWPVGGVTDKQTDKQTDRQTNGTDQYTLRKVVDFRKVMSHNIHKVTPPSMAQSEENQSCL